MMGQTLSEPVTVKGTSCCENSKFKVGSSCMQGWRINMEDSHTHILSLTEDPDTAFFGVYDGHGGSKVSEYAGNHLHSFIVNRPEYKEGDIAEAMKQGYLEMDKLMENDENLKKESSGTTAITVIIKDNQLYCANVGDSRAVACIAGKAIPLSNDHKPFLSEERRRIQAAGGWVDFDRVNGNLALSRALGDFVFKRNPNKKAEEQIVTAYPEVTVHTVTDEWEFIVLACDGIWDVMANAEVVNYIRDEIKEFKEPDEICENLMMRCLAPDLQMAGMGCDNMTVVIVGFLNGKPYLELASRCSKSETSQQDTSEEVNCDENTDEEDEEEGESEEGAEVRRKTIPRNLWTESNK